MVVNFYAELKKIDEKAYTTLTYGE